MDQPMLTMEERAAINGARWFSSLSPTLRHDILRGAYVRRYRDGELISARGDVPQAWFSCARGAIRMSSMSLTGKLLTLTYMEPGTWIGDVAIFNGEQHALDAHAHGQTTLLCVSLSDFRRLLAQHVELYEAIARLQAWRIRQLLGLVQDLSTLPLRARLAKRLLHLARSYGMPGVPDEGEVRIGLQLAQEELAQLLGASRQRVNQELKIMERQGVIRIEPAGLVVRNRKTLMRIANTASVDK